MSENSKKRLNTVMKQNRYQDKQNQSQQNQQDQSQQNSQNKKNGQQQG